MHGALTVLQEAINLAPPRALGVEGVEREILHVEHERKFLVRAMKAERISDQQQISYQPPYGAPSGHERGNDRANGAAGDDSRQQIALEEGLNHPEVVQAECGAAAEAQCRASKSLARLPKEVKLVLASRAAESLKEAEDGIGKVE